MGGRVGRGIGWMDGWMCGRVNQNLRRTIKGNKFLKLTQVYQTTTSCDRYSIFNTVEKDSGDENLTWVKMDGSERYGSGEISLTTFQDSWLLLKKVQRDGNKYLLINKELQQ